MLDSAQPENPELTQLNQLVETIHNTETNILLLHTREERVEYLRFMASMNGIELNQRQINTILQHAEFTAEQLLAQKTKTLDPKVKLALQLSIALSLIYYTPGLFAVGATNILLKAFLGKIMGNNAADRLVGYFNLAATCFFSDYTPRDLMNYYLPQLVEQYGPAVYLAAPLGVLLYQKGIDIIQGCGTALWNIGADCYALGHTLTDLANITEPTLPTLEEDSNNYYYADAKVCEDEDYNPYTNTLIRQFQRESASTNNQSAQTQSINTRQPLAPSPAL